VVSQKDLAQRNGQYRMGEFVFISQCFLLKHFGEEFPHEGIEVGVALPGGEITSMEQGKGHNDFQQPLLVLYLVRQTIKSGNSFEELPCRCFFEVLLVSSGSTQILVDQSDRYIDPYISS
jgi:hypothetical protein